MLLSDDDLYQRCKEGCRRLSMDFDRKKLASDMLEVIEETCNCR